MEVKGEGGGGGGGMEGGRWKMEDGWRAWSEDLVGCLVGSCLFRYSGICCSIIVYYTFSFLF